MMRVGILILAMAFLGSCRTTEKRDSAPVYSVTVETGDTLASIASRFNTTWQEIARENRMRDGRDLRIGQKLRVHPGPGGYVATAKGGAVERVSEDDEPANSNSNGVPRKRRGFFFGGNDEDVASESDNGETPASSSNHAWTPLPWPVSGDVSSEFGYRWGRLHAGIDIRAPRGTDILSPASGRVVFAGRRGDYGKFVLVDHGTFKTAYGHCSSISVKVGQRVKKGEVLGTVGATGNASGTHLHFEFRLADGRSVDPMYYLESRNRGGLLSSADKLGAGGS